MKAAHSFGGDGGHEAECRSRERVTRGTFSVTRVRTADGYFLKKEEVFRK